MKNFLLAFAVLFSVNVIAQNVADVKFDKSKHNFGKIKKGVPVSVVFTFTNASAKPLIVETATAECGCTTPEYSKPPVPKAKTGTVKATFNAANVGQFTKRVTVKFANITQPIILTIEGEVVESK